MRFDFGVMVVLMSFLISQCVGIMETEPAVVVYCASGGPADASCQDIRRLDEAEYETMVENEMNQVLIEFGKATTKAQQLYQSVIDWTSDTPTLVTDISCARSGNCPALPPVSKVDGVVQAMMVMHCVLGKTVVFTCTRAQDIVQPCQVSPPTRTGGVMGVGTNNQWKLFESSDSPMLDLPNPQFECPDTGVYSSKHVTFSGGTYPTQPLASDLELITRFNKIADNMYPEVVSLMDTLKLFNEAALEGAAATVRSLETIKKGSISTLVVLGTGGLVGAAGVTGVTAQVLTGAVAGGVNAIIGNIQTQLETISMCDPAFDTTNNCEFSFKDLALAVLKGVIVGVVANYIGASIGGLIKGAIPAPEVATLPLQKVTVAIQQCIGGAGAQGVRRAFLSIFFDKKGKFLGPNGRSNEEIWGEIFTAMIAGCTIDAFQLPSRNGLEGFIQAGQDAAANDPIRFRKEDARIQLLLNSKLHRERRNVHA